MKLVVVVAAVVLVMAVSALLMRRRRSDETHSVAGYRRTLETLADLGTRQPSGLGSAAAARRGASEAGGSAEIPPEGRPAESRPPVRSTEPVRRWTFEDAGPRRPQSTMGGRGLGRSVAPAGRARRYRIVLAMAAAAAVVIVVAVALVSGHHPGGKAGAAASSSSAPPAGGTHVSRHETTSTTAPAREQPVSSTATTATYTSPTASYVLTLVATNGRCWVQVTDAGKVVLALTIPAGTHHSITLSGQATVLLGAPTVITVSVDHVPVVLPTGYGAPFTMTFTPPAAG